MSVKSKVEDMTKKVAEVLTPSPEGETDVLDTLKEEHREVADLLDRLEKAESSAERRSLVGQIKAALIPHTKAEEKVVYDAVIAVKDKDSQVDGHEGYVEHELAARTLQKLAALTNATSPEHMATAKVLKELVTHHVKEEERNVWADVKKHFSKEDRFAMDRRYKQAKSKVKVP